MSYSGGGGGGGGLPSANLVRKIGGGSWDVNSVVWTDLDPTLDMQLLATPGQVIEYGINALVDPGAGPVIVFDVCTMVAGAPVNYFSQPGGVSNGNNGACGWYCLPQAGVIAVSGSITYTLQAGDISGGLVTLRIRTQLRSVGVRSVYNGAANPFLVWCKNHGTKAA